jgi:hypothetical protein
MIASEVLKNCCITNKKITKFVSALVLHTFHTISYFLKMCTLGGIFIIQHQNWSNKKMEHLRYDVKTNKCMQVYKNILYTPYTSYMFQWLMWPSSGRCITKDTYVAILQKFLNQCTDIKYYILKIYLCLCIGSKTSVIFWRTFLKMATWVA